MPSEFRLNSSVNQQCYSSAHGDEKCDAKFDVDGDVT